jgi:hypothetical protein
MGTLHYQVIYSGYHNNVQHWKYPPRIGKIEMYDWEWQSSHTIEFYSSAIVIADNDYEFDDDYGCHPLVVTLDEQDEDNQSYITEGWYWRYFNDAGQECGWGQANFFDSPYFSDG